MDKNDTISKGAVLSRSIKLDRFTKDNPSDILLGTIVVQLDQLNTNLQALLPLLIGEKKGGDDA